MGCSACGARVGLGARFCPACGSLVMPAPDEASAHAASPPPDVPYDPATRSTAVLGAWRSAYVGDRATPSAVSAPRAGGRPPHIALLLIALSLLLAFVATPLLAGAVPHSPPAAARSVCAQAIDPGAASSIAHATLASSIRTAGHAYEAAASTAQFRAGQAMYVTFEVASSAAGRLDARFCLGSAVIAGTLIVPVGSLGHSGEFLAHLPTTVPPPRAGVVVLLWNGDVATRLPFTVS